MLYFKRFIFISLFAGLLIFLNACDTKVEQPQSISSSEVSIPTSSMSSDKLIMQDIIVGVGARAEINIKAESGSPITDIEYLIDNEKIATINDEKSFSIDYVFGHQIGTATLMAVTPDGLSSTCVVTVTPTNFEIINQFQSKLENILSKTIEQPQKGTYDNNWIYSVDDIIIRTYAIERSDKNGYYLSLDIISTDVDNVKFTKYCEYIFKALMPEITESEMSTILSDANSTTAYTSRHYSGNIEQIDNTSYFEQHYDNGTTEYTFKFNFGNK